MAYKGDVQNNKDEDSTFWKHNCQKAVYQCIHAQAVKPPWSRIREKFERWYLNDPTKHIRLPGSVRERTPEWQSRRAWWLLQKLLLVAPPRVQAAAFSTIWNRWTTSRRFQATSVHSCLLGCEEVWFTYTAIVRLQAQLGAFCC